MADGDAPDLPAPPTADDGGEPDDCLPAPSDEAVTVARVDPEVTLPLRALVLRYGAPAEAARLATDDHAEAAAFAATTTSGVVVGTAVTCPEPPPWRPDDRAAWCLRGMATAPAWRGRGVGALVVAALIDHISARGGRIVWCRARVPARRFYEQAGFTTHGDEWEDPDHGPHIAMWRTVTPAVGPGAEDGAGSGPGRRGG